MLTPEELEVASDLIAPGQGGHGPMTYADLVSMWNDPVIPVPTEAELIATWRAHWLVHQQDAVRAKATQLIQDDVTGDLQEQLTKLMEFSVLLYNIHKGVANAEADADAMYADIVVPIETIHAHRDQLLSLLNDSTLDSIDVEVGTIDGLTQGWPSV